MDVKEENILVQSLLSSEAHAVLLDLGGAKQVSGTQLTDTTVYISTPKATRPERVQGLGKPVSRRQLQTWGVDLDLYAIGIMIKRALEGQSQSLKRRLEAELGISARVALEWVVERLTEGHSDDRMEMRHYKLIEGNNAGNQGS